MGDCRMIGVSSPLHSLRRSNGAAVSECNRLFTTTITGTYGPQVYPSQNADLGESAMQLSTIWASLLLTTVAAQVVCSGQQVETQSAPLSTPASTAVKKLPVFQMQFTKALHSSQLKPGDEVIAVPTDAPGAHTLHTGTKLIGHVTDVKARSKGGRCFEPNDHIRRNQVSPWQTYDHPWHHSRSG
jgi:hypothetical protein